MWGGGVYLEFPMTKHLEVYPEQFSDSKITVFMKESATCFYFDTHTDNYHSRVQS